MVLGVITQCHAMFRLLLTVDDFEFKKRVEVLTSNVEFGEHSASGIAISIAKEGGFGANLAQLHCLF